MKPERDHIVFFLLRIGVSFAFIYAGISGFINPQNWIGYFPPFLQNNVPDTVLIPLWGIVEFALGFWILSGKKIFAPSVLASASLIGLLIFNFRQMDVLFRDVTILATTIALSVWSFEA